MIKGVKETKLATRCIINQQVGLETDLAWIFEDIIKPFFYNVNVTKQYQI